MTEEKLIKIENIINDFFVKTRIGDFEIKLIEAIGDHSVNALIIVKDANLCIGEGGRNIGAFETLLRLVIKKQIESAPFRHLDINNYKKKKIEYLKELARSIADEVALTKKEKALSPMPAYERRIIHLELVGRGDVTSESIGQEPERRVVIRPYP